MGPPCAGMACPPFLPPLNSEFLENLDRAVFSVVFELSGMRVRGRSSCFPVSEPLGDRRGTASPSAPALCGGPRTTQGELRRPVERHVLPSLSALLAWRGTDIEGSKAPRHLWSESKAPEHVHVVTPGLGGCSLTGKRGSERLTQGRNTTRTLSRTVTGVAGEMALWRWRPGPEPGR